MVRGLNLLISASTHSFIAERLCCAMDGPQRRFMLPVVAQWVFSYVHGLRDAAAGDCTERRFDM